MRGGVVFDARWIGSCSFFLPVVPIFKRMGKATYTAAIIGTGRIGFSLGFDKKREQPASHTMALMKNRRIRIIAGCDTDSSRLEDWRRYVGKCAVYESAAHLFAAERPDIVVIAADETAHLPLALSAVKAKPRLIILEKPVALTVKDACTIANEAKLNAVPVMINHERRFAEDYQLAKNYLEHIGPLQSVTAELCSSLRVYSPDDECTGAYSLLHDGTHLVDIIQFLLADGDHDGENSAPSGRTMIDRYNLLSKPELTSVTFDTENPRVVRNVSVHFSSSRCNDVTMRISGRSRYFGFEVDIRGTEGRICIGNGFARFYRRAQSKLYSGFYSLAEDTGVKVPKKTRYFSNMVQNAVDFLDGNAPLRSTIRDGVSDSAVLESIKTLLCARLGAGGK